APDISTLQSRFGAEGLKFWLVFPNPAESVPEIRAHLAEFHYDVPALRDPAQQLVRRAGATITPEAAVYDRAGRLTYRGRIDDRYVRLGVMRPAATTHDLRDALTALVEARPAPASTAPAVGCYISDFVHAH